MELRSGSVSWLDFLLNRNLLPQYLSNPDAEPSPLTLLSQFLINIEKCADVSVNPSDAGGSGLDLIPGPETILKASRMQKNRTLRLMTIQTAAHLSWDLDVLCKLPLVLQNALMNHILTVGNDPRSNNKFLQCLYHRWVLRTFQTNKFSRQSSRPINPLIPNSDPSQQTDAILRSLSIEKALESLENTLQSLDLSSKVFIPTVATFSGAEPDWTVGMYVAAELFASILHLDLGIYLLFDGSKEEAVEHLKAQKIPTEDFPYLKISQKKLDGFLAAVGLRVPAEDSIKQVPVPTLDHGRTVDIARLLLQGDYKQIVSMFDSSESQLMDTDEDDIRPLDPTKIPKEPEPIVGREQLEMYNCERMLLETADFDHVKRLVIRLNTLNMGCSVVPKLFSEWELPVPIQHATEKIPPGTLRDYVHVLVAKAKQHLNLGNFSQARKALLIAKADLDDSLRTPAAWVFGFGQYNARKLGQMLEWEILLIDIAEMIMEWSANAVTNHGKIIERCTECIRSLEDPTAEVSPRSEIIEFILIALINLGEYKLVIKFEESQKRWPFVEFLGLLARVCRDIGDKKDVSPHYRELWLAVLPVCMNSMGVKIQRVLGKEGILSNRSSLAWVLDRCCSHTLITVFVSLLSRLHNHILDDVALQIHTDFLHVWPNIIDDVTLGSPLDAKGRVSGVKNLNVRQVQDFLFHLLQLALLRSEETLWLKCQGDVYLASGSAALAMKSYVEHLAISTDFFEKHSSPYWNDNPLFRKMIKCCESLQCFTQAIILCQFLTDVDYTTAFGMAQEKVTLDGSDSLYGFVWDLTILEFLENLHTKRNELKKRQEVVRLLGLLELNANNNEEIQREAMYLRKSQFMRTLAKMYVFV